MKTPITEEELEKVRKVYFELIKALAVCHKWAGEESDIKRIKELMRKTPEASSILSTRNGLE